MTVAIHISFNGSPAGLSESFNYQCFSVLAGKYPDSHFIFIFDDASLTPDLLLPNCTPVTVGPPIRNSLLLHYWYNFKLPAILKKYNADVFISTGGICGLKVSIPQCIILQNEKTNGWQAYLKKYREKFFEKAAVVFVTTERRLKLSESETNHHKRIRLVYHGLDPAYRPSTENEKTVLRENLSDGTEYFLYVSQGNKDPYLLTMLKAFSLFKKWQKSNMKLVILSPKEEDDIVPDYKNYKYIEDVKVLPFASKEITSGIMSAAYAAIYLPPKNKMTNAGLEALASGAPLITTPDPYSKLLYGEAASTTVPDEGNISKQMILLYKNEDVRAALLENAKEVVRKYSWDNSASIIWENLQLL